MMLSIVGTILPYVPETAIFIADGYQDWNTLAVHAYTNSVNIEPWPGLTAALQTEGKWSDASELTSTSIYAVPGSSAFYTSTLDVRLQASGVTGAAYQIDGGAVTANCMYTKLFGDGEKMYNILFIGNSYTFYNLGNSI